MSTTTEQLDPKTASKSEYGVSASRKATLVSYDAPPSTLAHHGVEIPHRDFTPDEAYEYPTTVVFDEDGSKVHLHQDVREDMDDEFGSFGNVDEDEEDVVWTVVDLCDETVSLTVVGDWGQRRTVPFEDFPQNYEALSLEDGEPRWGY